MLRLQSRIFTRRVDKIYACVQLVRHWLSHCQPLDTRNNSATTKKWTRQSAMRTAAPNMKKEGTLVEANGMAILDRDGNKSLYSLWSACSSCLAVPFLGKEGLRKLPWPGHLSVGSFANNLSVHQNHDLGANHMPIRSLLILIWRALTIPKTCQRWWAQFEQIRLS